MECPSCVWYVDQNLHTEHLTWLKVWSHDNWNCWRKPMILDLLAYKGIHSSELGSAHIREVQSHHINKSSLSILRDLILQQTSASRFWTEKLALHLSSLQVQVLNTVSESKRTLAFGIRVRFYSLDLGLDLSHRAHKHLLHMDCRLKGPW